MAFSKDDRVMRNLNFAIIDEVDSILIDEARTPLIISGATDDNSDLYKKINVIIPHLTPQEQEPQKDDEVEIPGDYYVDEKHKQVFLSDEGHQHVEEFLIKKWSA
ncbi:preprotein translocase, SecA subunit [Beggiatoa sp. PS]|nr:preprotein translocase, SecA subunit [Beggiatoa sp. PS]